MRAVIRAVYTVRELRDHEPRAYAFALEGWQQVSMEDPFWASEHAASTDVALRTFTVPDDAADLEGPRAMAWIENNVLRPLRIGWVPMADRGPLGERRRRFAKYGASYRPGMIRPCPWTGYCLDDALIDFAQREVREGCRLGCLAGRIREEADRLWEEECAAQCSEETFLQTAEDLGWEFTSDGLRIA